MSLSIERVDFVVGLIVEGTDRKVYRARILQRGDGILAYLLAVSRRCRIHHAILLQGHSVEYGDKYIVIIDKAGRYHRVK